MLMKYERKFDDARATLKLFVLTVWVEFDWPALCKNYKTGNNF